MPQEQKKDQFVYTSVEHTHKAQWDAFVQSCRVLGCKISLVAHEEWGSQICFADFASWEKAEPLRRAYFDEIKDGVEFGQWVDAYDTDGVEDADGNFILTPQFRLFVSSVSLEDVE